MTNNERTMGHVCEREWEHVMDSRKVELLEIAVRGLIQQTERVLPLLSRNAYYREVTDLQNAIQEAFYRNEDLWEHTLSITEYERTEHRAQTEEAFAVASDPRRVPHRDAEGPPGRFEMERQNATEWDDMSDISRIRLVLDEMGRRRAAP